MLRKFLLVLGCLVPSMAGASWQQASSRHFIVYSDDSPEHVRDFTTRLERFDKGMRLLHGVGDDPRGPSSRVTIFVVDTIADVQRLAGKDVKNAAGFYFAAAGGAFAFTPRNSGEGGDHGLTAQAILLHEYTHHWMYSNWTDAVFPKWFSEGFAEFHATALFRKDGSIVFGAVPTYRAYGITDANTIPVQRLLQPNPGKLDADQTAIFYGRAWLLTHYLTFDTDRRTQLGAYIAAINAGKSIDDASSLLGDIGGLDLKMNSYVKRPFLPSVTFTTDQLPIGEINVRALGPGEAAMMPALMRSKRYVDATTAPAVVTLARELAAPFPNDPAAQNELAEAEFDAAATGEKEVAAAGYARAEAAADRALAADPKSVHALIYKGMAEMALARMADVTDPAKWLAIRHLFLAANKIDTENAEPLVLFYESFGAAKQEPTRNAEGGLLYAYSLAPYDLGLRVSAALVLLRQGKADAAKAALKPVAYDPHGSNTDSPAIRAIAALDQNDIAGAIAALRPPPAKTTKAGDTPKDGKSDDGSKSNAKDK